MQHDLTTLPTVYIVQARVLLRGPRFYFKQKYASPKLALHRCIDLDTFQRPLEKSPPDSTLRLGSGQRRVKQQIGASSKTDSQRDNQTESQAECRSRDGFIPDYEDDKEDTDFFPKRQPGRFPNFQVRNRLQASIVKSPP